MRIILSLAVLLLPLHSHAWGVLGHQVSVEIAARHANPIAKNAVISLLAGEDLHQSSWWADRVKYHSEFSQTAKYHFTDVPDGEDYLKFLARNTRTRGDVLLGILEAEAELANSANAQDVRARALKFLFHFVGDMHQPLHTGRDEDQGGHLVEVDWFGEPTNLHHMWDSQIMYAAHPANLHPHGEGDEMTVWYADYLEKTQGGKEVCDRPDPLAWVNESVAARTAAYDGYDADNNQYLSRSTPVLERQVYRAGLHIACLLNAIFPEHSMPEGYFARLESWFGLAAPSSLNPNADVKKQVEKILSTPLEKIIDLKPKS